MVRVAIILAMVASPALAQTAANGASPDLNKEVTLTYGELQRLVDAQVMHAMASQKADDVMKKVQSQLQDKK